MTRRSLISAAVLAVAFALAAASSAVAQTTAPASQGADMTDAASQAMNAWVREHLLDACRPPRRR